MQVKIKPLLIYSYVCFILFATSCKNKSQRYVSIEGETMGTTYHITYSGTKNLKQDIDSLLQQFSKALSTYDSTSFLSRWNKSKYGVFEYEEGDEYLWPLLSHITNESKYIFTETQGAVDPGMAAIINYWGFGENKKKPEEANITLLNYLREFCSIRYVNVGKKTILKTKEGVTLNFNAIAPGYATDLVCLFLDKCEVQNYMVEISGEIRSKGVNPRNNPWKIGIEEPQNNPNIKKIFALATLSNRSMATSGNYRNFFKRDGKNYGHTIDPRTGFPAENEMLSATIFASSCTDADAFATACMVLGLEEAIKLVESRNDLQGFFIYNQNETLQYWVSPDLEKNLTKTKH